MGLSTRRWVLMTLLVMGGCEDPREWRSRQAVRQLVEASPLRASAAMRRVVSVGCYALVDIEQAFHGAPLPGRRRLLEAIRSAGCREATPLLRFIERWDDEEEIRRQARRTRLELSKRGPG
jgi:hypothetical protein